LTLISKEFRQAPWLLLGLELVVQLMSSVLRTLLVVQL
jgi:hypothetical protein